MALPPHQKLNSCIEFQTKGLHRRRLIRFSILSVLTGYDIDKTSLEIPESEIIQALDENYPDWRKEHTAFPIEFNQRLRAMAEDFNAFYERELGPVQQPISLTPEQKKERRKRKRQRWMANKYAKRQAKRSAKLAAKLSKSASNPKDVKPLPVKRERRVFEP